MAPTTRDTAWIAQEFDRRAAHYDESAMHQWQAALVADLVAELRPRPGWHVLDVATGTGLAIRASAGQLDPRSVVVGIDLSQQMLQVAQDGERPRSYYLRADTAQLPFADATFDLVLCVSAIPYFHDFGQVLAEWRRVIRSHGQLIFSVPAAGGFTMNRLLEDAAAAHGVALADPHASLGDAQMIEATVEPHGFVLDDVQSHFFSEPLKEAHRTRSPGLSPTGSPTPWPVFPIRHRMQCFRPTDKPI